MDYQTRGAKQALTFHRLKMTDRELTSSRIIHKEGAEKQGMEVQYDHMVTFSGYILMV